MPFQNLDVAAFVDHAPEFSFSGGLFHVRQRYSDSCVIERVMSPRTMLISFQRAAQAIQDYHASEGDRPDAADVITFPRAS